MPGGRDRRPRVRVTGAVGATALAVLAVVIVERVTTGERTATLLGGVSGEVVQPEPRRHRRGVPLGALVPIGAVAAAIVGYRLAGIAGSLAAVVGVWILPRMVGHRRARRRARRMQEHLADAVALVATAMRSGRSLLQAIELSADELDPSLGDTFRTLVDRVELGDAMDDAIDAWAFDVGGPDARLVAGVLKLHRRTGGSLSTTLEDLAGTLRSRRTAAREVESLTAQARLSATILGLLPIGFFLFLSVVAREDLEAAYETPAGVAAVGLGLALQGAAYLWIRSLLRVEA